MSQELKAQCEEILAKLVEKYGGQNKRLQSVKYFQEHHVGEAAFLMAACPKAYGKSCTAMLTERGILMILHRLKQDVSPVTCKISDGDMSFTLKYQPRAMISNVVYTVECMINGGYFERLNDCLGRSCVLQCENPEEVAEFLHDRRMEDNLEEKWAMESNATKIPLEEGAEQLKAFEDLCLLLLNKEKLVSLFDRATRKADGTLHKNLRTPITWNGCAIDCKAYALELVAKSDTELKLEIEHYACDHRFVKKYKDVPIAVDMLEEFRAL